MTTKTASWFDMTAADAVGAGAIGAGLGLGARGLRHILDLKNRRDVAPPVEIPAVKPNRIKMPVEVSEEEAAQLEQQGVPVTHKQAATLLDNVAMGGLGTAAAYGGWKVLDGYLDRQRRQAAQARLDKVRSRVQGLLDDQPKPMDVGLHATMKAAEDLFMAKEAGWQDIVNSLNPANMASGVASGFANLAAPIGIPLAAGAMMLGASSFNDSRDKNKYRQTAKAIRNYSEHQNDVPPEAELVPVVTHRKKNDEMMAPKLAALGARLKTVLDARSAR